MKGAGDAAGRLVVVVVLEQKWTMRDLLRTKDTARIERAKNS